MRLALPVGWTVVMATLATRLRHTKGHAAARCISVDLLHMRKWISPIRAASFSISLVLVLLISRSHVLSVGVSALPVGALPRVITKDHAFAERLSQAWLRLTRRGLRTFVSYSGLAAFHGHHHCGPAPQTHAKRISLRRAPALGQKVLVYVWHPLHMTDRAPSHGQRPLTRRKKSLWSLVIAVRLGHAHHDGACYFEVVRCLRAGVRYSLQFGNRCFTQPCAVLDARVLARATRGIVDL